MIYRIDFQNFLLHAIDHLSFMDLNYCEYAIVSSRITCGLRDMHCARINLLYPKNEIVDHYAATGDYEQLEREMIKMYDDMLKEDKTALFYNTFVKPIEDHINVMIVCHREENHYVDALCKFLKKRLYIEVIDLNQLFTKGKLDTIHYDYDKIRDRAVDIRRNAKHEEAKSKASTEEGRMQLLQEWDKKTKLKLCKNLKIRVRSNLREKDIDAILIDAWVKDDDD